MGNQTDGVGQQCVSVRRGGRLRWRSIGLLGTLVLVLGLTGIVTAGVALAGGSNDAAGARQWKLEPTPNPATAEISVLSSVACASHAACTAVGSSAETLSSPTLPLAERWNGKRWSIQAIPAPTGSSDTLYGVSCPSARECIAVGSAFYTAGHRQTTLAEVWNGKRWRVQTTPTVKSLSALYAVSCPSASSCTAVGFFHNSAGRTQVMAESWDGKTWRLQAIPQPAQTAQLLGVSCPTAHACTAIGSRGTVNGNARPLAESWNGKKWQVQVVPLPQGAPGGIFDAVSCTSPNACTATGTDFDGQAPTLAERWNGKTWQLEPTPNPADYQTSIQEVALNAVSCTSAKACTATGEYSPGGSAQYFIESWNGRQWRLEPTPKPAGFAHGALLGIACASARCTAVGAYTGQVRVQVTLAMAN